MRPEEVCRCVYVYVQVCMCVCVCVHVHTYVHVCVCLHACMYCALWELTSSSGYLVKRPPHPLSLHEHPAIPPNHILVLHTVTVKHHTSSVIMLYVGLFLVPIPNLILGVGLVAIVHIHTYVHV